MMLHCFENHGIRLKPFPDYFAGSESSFEYFGQKNSCGAAMCCARRDDAAALQLFWTLHLQKKTASPERH